MADTPRPPAAGQAAPMVMGRFRCEHRLVADQWLETWRARVQGLAGFDQLFAVHRLTPGALARRPSAAESMLRAARSTANIRDPRVATVHDSGLAPGTAFVARELVHGISLRDLELYLHGGENGVGSAPPPLPPGFAGVLAHVAAEIAAALAAAHAPEPAFPHGALGPTAVMVTPQGTIKLIDLGLRASVLTPQEIAASPTHGPYAAPELARGELTTASDLYALGRVVAGLGGGGSPGRGADAIRALPGILQTCIRRVLAEDPRQRPVARQAEEQLRVAARGAREVDAQAELGRLVRVVMQIHASRPRAEGELEGGELPGGRPYEGPAAPAPTELFTDEPTAILALSGDGNPSPLASLLRELRGAEEAEEQGADAQGDRTAIPTSKRAPEQAGHHHFVTPVLGAPVVSDSPAPYQSFTTHSSPTVMTSANLPLSPAMGESARPGGPAASASGPAPRIIQVLPTQAPRSTPSRTMKVPEPPAPIVSSPPPTARLASESSNGTPVEELKDLTTEEIAASFDDEIERTTRDMKAEDGVPQPVVFRGFSTAIAAKSGGTMTPASWKPAGNLEEAGLAGERPGSLGGIEIPTGRKPKQLLTMALGAAAGVLVLATVGLLLGRTMGSRSPNVRARSEVVAPADRATPSAASIPVRAPITAPLPEEIPATAPTAMPGKRSRRVAAQAEAETAPEAAETAPVMEKAAAEPAAEPAAVPAEKAASTPTATTPEQPTAVARSASAEPAEQAPAPPSVAAAEPAVPAREGQSGLTAEVKPPVPVEASREVEVRTTPPGAMVLVAGQARGITPVTIYIPSDVNELKLVRSGYRVRTISLGPTTEKLIEASLTPLEE